MEFKVFKNENSKILKEYWLTQSEWDALDKATVQEGDIYHIVGTIDKGDLSADVNASLAKGDSSLQKPTATLAKESFVKVGIDGSQNFDESSYVIAPSTDGTAGQVLKKTASGTEWADESGGGGGGKLYLHHIKITAYLDQGSGVLFDGMISIDMYSSSATKFTLDTFIHDDAYYYYVGVVNDNQLGRIGTVCIHFNGHSILTYGAAYINNSAVSLQYRIPYTKTQVIDTVTEV